MISLEFLNSTRSYIKIETGWSRENILRTQPALSGSASGTEKFLFRAVTKETQTSILVRP